LRQIAERVPGGAIWLEARVGLEVVGSDVRRLRKLELLPIPAGDDEDTLPELRDPVAGRVDDAPHRLVLRLDLRLIFSMPLRMRFRPSLLPE
jgi:hypothetical protein